MNKVFFEELRLPKPDYHLGVGSGSHAKQTGMMLERIEIVLKKENPKIVVVYGDTNSTLAGALAAGDSRVTVLCSASCGVNGFMEKDRRPPGND